MVKPAEVPKTYEDLLNPRWKGQMMWSTSRGSGAPMFVGTILNSMGIEAGKAYLQKLKAQNIAKSTASNRQVLDLTIAGEYPLGAADLQPSCLYQQVGGRAGRLAALEPATATINTVALRKTRRTRMRPCSCSILLCRRRGQRVYQQSNYLPAHPKVPAKQADLKPGGGRFISRAYYINPDTQYDKGNEWVDYL